MTKSSNGSLKNIAYGRHASGLFAQKLDRPIPARGRFPAMLSDVAEWNFLDSVILWQALPKFRSLCPFTCFEQFQRFGVLFAAAAAADGCKRAIGN